MVVQNLNSLKLPQFPYSTILFKVLFCFKKYSKYAKNLQKHLLYGSIQLIYFFILGGGLIEMKANLSDC